MSSDTVDYAEAQSRILSPLGHSLVPVSESNTRALLLDASQELAQHLDRAAQILTRLQQLNPEVARKFRAKEDVLKLLRLRLICSPPRTPAPSFSSYIIVSYCWHSPEWTPVAGAQPPAPGWEISRPMADAIMGLREDNGEGVWLDRMCINQADAEDKKLHIGGMDMIYRSARRVVILLEDIRLSEDEAFAGQTYAGFYADLCRDVKDKGLEGEEKRKYVAEYFPRRQEELRAQGHEDLQAFGRQFVMKMLRARWFSRAWCAHECRAVRHAKVNNPLMLCFAPNGSVLRFEFRFVHYFSLYMSDREPDDPYFPPTAEQQFNFSVQDPATATLRQLWWRIMKLHPDTSPRGTAMQHLVSIFSQGCSRREDLVSIALNTAGIPLYYVGETLQAEDIVWIFSLLVLAARDAVPLVMDGTKLTIKRPSDGREVISWAPRPTEAVLGDVYPIPSDECITAVTGEYIELDLMVFKSGPIRPSGESMETAEKIIEEHNLIRFAQGLSEGAEAGIHKLVNMVKGEINRVKGDDGPLTTFIPIWIAYSIDCGLEWTLRFPEVLRKQTEGVWMHGTLGDTSYPELRDAAESLLARLLPSETDCDGQHREHYLDGLTKFLSCVLDPRLQFITVSPRCLPCMNGDFAFTQSTSNRSYIAMPVAVWNLPFGEKVGWIIEPFDLASDPERPEDHLPDLARKPEPDGMASDIFPVLTSDSPDLRPPRNKEGTWRLRYRQEIFGCDPRGWYSSSEEGPVMLLKRQRVYGSLNYDWRAITKAAAEYEDKYGLQRVY